MSAGRASSRCAYYLLLEQGVWPVAVGRKVSRNRCPDGEHLPGEQVLSSRYSVLGGSGPGDLEARAFALAR